jgi:hypothetical protein
VHLVEPFTVVGETTPPDLVSASGPQLQIPVRVGERLTGGCDDVGGAGRQDSFRLIERMDPAGDDDRGVQSGGANSLADALRGPHVAPERTGGVAEHRRHALPAAPAGIGVRRPADFRLLRVFEFAAPRQREEVHARPGELHAEEHRIRYRAPRFDAVVAQIPATQDESIGNGAAHRMEDFERQPDPSLRRTTVAVRPGVPRRQKRCHRVRVCVVQLDPVEASRRGAVRRSGEDAGQHRRKLTDVWSIDVGDPLAQTEVHGLDLARREDFPQLLVRHREERRPHRGIILINRVERC